MRKLACLYFVFLSLALHAQSPPLQPTTGPGGSTYPHTSYTFSKFGSDIFDCYWIAEPDGPRPDSAEVIVFWHGTTTQTNSDQIPGGTALFLEHLVKKGYTIIFPLYQDGNTTLPFQQQLENGAAVVSMALTELENGAGRVRPKKYPSGKFKLGAVGISRGGGMTVNVASFHQSLALPSFDALCAIVPSAGQSVQGIDPTTKVLLVNSDNNELNYSSSFELWDSLSHIPCSNKLFIEVNSDSLGFPALTADHSFAGTGANAANQTEFNALDFYGTLKWSTALFDCTFKNQNCNYCLGTDPLITYMGTWSDGTPVEEATLIDSCSTTSSNELSTLPFSIFPNPANKTIRIDLVNEEIGVKIAIYDLEGRFVLASSDTTINVEVLKSGCYFIAATDKEGNHFSAKFVKID